MRCVMVMYDSLNRHMLPPYRDDTFVHAPNFQRLAERTVTFDTSYVCSMPCMPARRDLHTGRPNFLHTGWGPLEPFDDSMPQMLTEAGVCTHLDTDHYHYFEDGGATYHNRYGSWQAFRGQEGDPFIGQAAEPDIPEHVNGKGRRSDWVNRRFIRRDEQCPQTHTFKAGLDFIERNKDDDNWFVQIETFDPHEPFTTDRRWRDLYSPDEPDTPLHDWPAYGKRTCSDAELEAARRNYAGLMSKCDASLGDVLDAFDRHDLWQDTMLIVWTDHGYMLGEHGWMAKNTPPMYEEIVHTPFFVWDPRSGKAGERRRSLVQPSIDLAPTLLRFFGLEPTKDMTGKDLAAVIADDTPVREAGIFGYFRQDVCVTDGRYVYFRGGDDTAGAHCYTLVPMAMRNWKPGLVDMTLVEPFAFTKGHPVLKVPTQAFGNGRDADQGKHVLFDLEHDGGQQSPLDDSAVEQRMIERMVHLMAEVDAPVEQYDRLGVERPQAIGA